VEDSLADSTRHRAVAPDQRDEGVVVRFRPGRREACEQLLIRKPPIAPMLNRVLTSGIMLLTFATN